jgi:hypothetical protein
MTSPFTTNEVVWDAVSVLAAFGRRVREQRDFSQDVLARLAGGGIESRSTKSRLAPPTLASRRSGVSLAGCEYRRES